MDSLVIKLDEQDMFLLMEGQQQFDEHQQWKLLPDDPRVQHHDEGEFANNVRQQVKDNTITNLIII